MKSNRPETCFCFQDAETVEAGRQALMSVSELVTWYVSSPQLHRNNTCPPLGGFCIVCGDRVQDRRLVRADLKGIHIFSYSKWKNQSSRAGASYERQRITSGRSILHIDLQNTKMYLENWTFLQLRT